MNNVNKCFKEGYQFYCDSIGAALNISKQKTGYKTI